MKTFKQNRMRSARDIKRKLFSLTVIALTVLASCNTNANKQDKDKKQELPAYAPFLLREYEIESGGEERIVKSAIKSELPENALFILREYEDETVTIEQGVKSGVKSEHVIEYVVAVSFFDFPEPNDTLPLETFIETRIKNGVYRLIYVKEIKSDESIRIGRDEIILYVSPEGDDRFRLEELLISSNEYENGKRVIHSEVILEVEFVGYSDDMELDGAKVFKYFHEQRVK